MRKEKRAAHEGEGAATCPSRLFESVLEFVDAVWLPWNEAADPIRLPAVGFPSMIAQRLGLLDSTMLQRGITWE